MPEEKREYILYFYDGKVRRVTGKLSQLQKLPVSKIEETNPEGSRKMPEEKLKISPGLIIVAGLALGLVGALGLGAFALARAARVGFSLGIVNAPPGAVLWNANFAEQAWDYDPFADSGWLGIDESWEYPSDPLGCTTLRIWALDAEGNILFDFRNLGPLESGKSYVFDCVTGELLED